MAHRLPSASALPWIWVIQALANLKEVDLSILIDLVKKTPEISDDLGKNARETVSLRILESYVNQTIESTKGVSFALDSKVEFDPSEHCEDVVQYILHDFCEEWNLEQQRISASNLRSGPEILKWDFQTFIRHKRACLPKCTLQQLKHAILEGSYPILESLKGRSGLSMNNQSETEIPVDDGDLNIVVGRLEGCLSGGQTTEAGGNLISPTPENSDGLWQEYLPGRNLLPSKRNRSDLDAEKQAAESDEDHIIMHNGRSFHLHDTKKLKQDATCTDQPIGQKAVPIALNEPSINFIRSNGRHTVRESSGLAIVSQAGYLEESRSSEDGHDQHIALKMPGLRNDAVYILQQNNPQISCNNNLETQDTSGDGPHGDLPVHEAKNDDDRCGEIGTSYSAAPDVTYQNICGNGAGDQCEKSQLNTFNGAPLYGFYQSNFPDESKKKHNPGQETSSDSDDSEDENIDIARKKQTFLSSLCTFSRDYLGTPDCTELNLCMKCKKGDSLLVCRASTCPLVIHQNCLVSAASLDDSGNFYCPFCAYSRAISEYLEVKKKVSLTRKDLAGIIGLKNGCLGKKLSKRFLRPDQNELMQDDTVNRNHQATHNGNRVKEVNNSQYEEYRENKRQVAPSASCICGKLPRGEKYATINDGTLCVLVEGNTEGKKMGSECQSAREHGKQVGAQVGDKLGGDNSSASMLEVKQVEAQVGDKLGGDNSFEAQVGDKLGGDNSSASMLEVKQVEAQVGDKLGDDNSSCRDTDIISVTKKHAEDRMKQEVLQKPISDSQQEAAYPSNIDADECSDEENDEFTSKYYIRFRRQEKQYTHPAIPHLRRKKVPWTAVEEEKLKEGVRIFSSVHGKTVPWKRILEFESGVFQKGRTPIDLKDKWRNICKGSPKST